MSEKRFTGKMLVATNGEEFGFTIYDEDKRMSIKGVVDLLNEQQDIIDKLDQENADLLGARIKAQEEWEKCTDKLKERILEQQATINKQEEIIKSQDMEISRQYNLCLAMSGVLREEFGVYDVFDRSKDKRVK